MIRSTFALRPAYGFLFAALLSALTGCLSSPAPELQERDRWLAILEGEVRFGHQHDRVAPLEGTQVRYDRSVRALVDLFSSQEQEITIEGSYVVESDLRPVSMRCVTHSMAGKAVTTAVVRSGALQVTLERGGALREKTHSLDTGETVLFSVTLDEWLARSTPAVKEARLLVLSDETGDLEAFDARRIRMDDRGFEWHLASAEGLGERRFAFDPDGNLLSDTSIAPNQRLVPCTEEEARDLSYLVIDGRDALTFPLDRPITLPHRLERLEVELTWKDIPFENFEVEDARQRLLAQEVTQDGHVARLEITIPSPLGTPAAFPVERADMAPYLAETEFIKPYDASIQKAAEEATEGATDALEAVAALSRWVNGFIDGQLIAATLTGPEVLACGKGKCSEYSTLFASLARSRGIPTRLVLGERLVGNQWMGHMWNEAWVGRWVTVDSTVNEVDHSMMLLKFTHSDTVDGTQSLRWALPLSLEISLVDYDLSESALAQDFTTGIEGTTYTNVDHLARLSAPAGWTLEDKSEGGTTIVSFTPPNTSRVAVHFLAFPVPEGTPASTYVEARTASFQGQFESFKTLANGTVQVRGATGHHLQSSGITGEGEVEVIITETGWVRGPIGYLWTMNAPRAEHESWSEPVESILDGFRFLDE